VATEGCPLLLETPAGQGSEVLTNSTDFLEFIQAQEQPHLKICVDTCHVFSAGENPHEYIKKVPKEQLKLIHFNDSKEGQGCCKDRHEFPGLGKVGLEILKEVAEYTYNTVDKVYE
jgi:deoxyribonuclease IV